MKPERRSLGACLILFAAFASGPSCSSTSTEDSQTHFFSTCDDDSECGALECVCGRCTTRCDAEACSSGSVCAASDSEAAGELCGLAEAPAVCLPECTAPSDCGDGNVCIDGTCTKELPTVTDCTIETLLDYVIGDPSGIVDCGTLPVLPPANQSTPAQDCAMSSAQDGADFKVIWTLQGTDSLLRNAIASVREGGASRTYAFHYDSMGFSATGTPPTATAAWETCRALDANEVCSPEQGLCITCERDDVVRCECRVERETTGPGRIYCK